MNQHRQLTRRTFLENAVSRGVAGTTGLVVLGSPVLGRAGHVPPSERIQLGIIGAGVQSLFHFDELLKLPDVEITAVCDVWKERLDAAVARCKGKARPFHDYRDLLAQPDVDAVVIVTPPHWHALMAIHACQAGKDIYVEKPMTLSVAESLAVLRAVQKYGRISQVGTQIHAGNNYRRVVDIVRSGVLGPINVVRTFHVLNQGTNGIGNTPDGDPPSGLDWDLWKGPGLDRAFNAMLVKGAYEHASFMYSGGWTPGMAPHVIDLPYWALKLGHPTCVSSSGGRYVISDCGDAYDTHEVLWQYPNFTLTWMTSLVNSYGWDFQQNGGIRRRNGCYFHGTNGTLIATYGTHRIIPEGDRLDEQVNPPKVIAESPGHHREWLDGIRRRENPSAHVGYHYKIDIAINLSLISLELGRSVRFDPATETIVGDPEAAARLQATYRLPWRLPDV